MPSKVIIITGLPASGKTSIGKQLADIMQIPFVSKDDVKELIFDNFNWSNKDRREEIGKISYNLFYYFVEMLLKSGTDFIVESNFRPKFDNSIWQDLARKYSPNFFQVLCFAKKDVLFERFKNRIENGKRHLGHDVDYSDKMQLKFMSEDCDLLDIPCEKIEVDTNDFINVNIEDLLEKIK